MMRATILHLACLFMLSQPLLGANIHNTENKNNGNIGKPDILDADTKIEDNSYMLSDENVTINNSPQQADPCDSGPCYNGGTCIAFPNTKGFMCICDGRHFGDLCKDPCDSGPCYNGGTCIAFPNTRGFICFCEGTYFGDQCEKKCTCQNGHCSRDNLGRKICTCPSGYSHSGINECKACNCGKYANCTFETEKKYCICAIGQREEKGTCVGTELCGKENRVCKHGLCLKAHPSSYCSCDDGYNEPYCEDTSTGLCGSENKACQHGICKRNPPVSYCYCDDGYMGSYCDNKKPVGGINPFALVAGIIALIAFTVAITLFSVRYLSKIRV